MKRLLLSLQILTSEDPGTGKVKGKFKAAGPINSYLNILQNKLHYAHVKLSQSNIPVTAESSGNKMNALDECSKNLINVVTAYHKNMEKLIGLYLTSFVKWKYKSADISLS